MSARIPTCVEFVVLINVRLVDSMNMELMVDQLRRLWNRSLTSSRSMSQLKLA